VVNDTIISQLLAEFKQSLQLSSCQTVLPWQGIFFLLCWLRSTNQQGRGYLPDKDGVVTCLQDVCSRFEKFCLLLIL